MKLKTLFISMFLVLLSSCDVVYGQGNPTFSPSISPLYTNSGVKIQNKAFTSSTSDTTLAFPTGKVGGLQLYLQSKDSASILIYYQRSYDSLTYTAAVLIDSLKQSTDVSTDKTVEFTTAVLGAPWTRYIFKFSNIAYAIGVTSPYYSAALKLHGTP